MTKPALTSARRATWLWGVLALSAADTAAQATTSRRPNPRRPRAIDTAVPKARPAVPLYLSWIVDPSPFVVGRLRTGLPVDSVYAALGVPGDEMHGCLYDRKKKLPRCLIARPPRQPDGVPADTVEFSVDRYSGVVLWFAFRWHVPTATADSARQTLAATLAATFGKPAAVYGGRGCTEWGDRDRGAALCAHQNGLVQLSLYDNTLFGVAERETEAKDRDEFAENYDYRHLTWWPVWRPFYLGTVRSGMEIESIASALQAGSAGMRCTPKRDAFGRVQTDSVVTCTWTSLSFSLAGQPARRLVADVDAASRRAHSIRLEFGSMPTKELAGEAVAAFVAAVRETWGAPTSERPSEEAEWKRQPFRATIRRLCWRDCAPGEPWQVWLYLTSLSAGAERDELALRRGR